MKDYDVILIGGGINGLTTAAYLQKSGLSVGVFEARGQCGAHCDTIELGIPGFLHNTHAAWLVPAMGPPMLDLELESYGLDLRGTDVIFAKPFKDGKNSVQALDLEVSLDSVARHSEADAARVMAFQEFGAENMEEAVAIAQLALFAPPTMEVAERTAKLNGEMCKAMGLPIDGDDVSRMTGFELLEIAFESEHVRTLPGALGEFTGQWPLNHRVGPTVLGLCGMTPMAVHTAKGGSHALTHALVKCFVSHGGEIWNTCPVTKILTEDGKAVGIELSDDAALPGEQVFAKTIISNLTLAPTFLDLLGEDVIGPDWARRIKYFNYDDPQLVGINLAMKDAPVFKSAEYNPAIQRSWVGYLGGDTLAEIRNAQMELMAGVVPENTMGGYFNFTLADPSQAPPGYHTCSMWVSTPPNPRRWGSKRLNGWKSWGEGLGDAIADEMIDLCEELAPGFKDLIIERHINTPCSQFNANPSAVRGNMVGGSAIPEQFGENRPLPGVCPDGVSRSFIPGLYLSNSIHPFGATHLASGYLAAVEIAEDLGCREQPWWVNKPLEWFLENMFEFPTNLGVDAKWTSEGAE